VEQLLGDCIIYAKKRYPVARLTVSLDAASATYDIVRGREKFFDKTSTTIQTLLRVRNRRGSGSTSG
jgi:MoaA/NifB/PqqE/SkfB family radical SAM enzyme